MRYLDVAAALRASLVRGRLRRRRGARERGRSRPPPRREPGHRAPRARGAAPRGSRHQPPGSGVVRRRRSRAPGARAGHDGRGRARGVGRDGGAPRPRVRFRARAARRRGVPRPRRRAPRCCACAGSPSPTASRSRSSPCGCPAALGAQLSRDDAQRAPFYELLAARGTALGSATQTIGADIADADDVRLLGVAPGAAGARVPAGHACTRRHPRRSRRSTVTPRTARPSRSISRASNRERGSGPPARRRHLPCPTPRIGASHG